MADNEIQQVREMLAAQKEQIKTLYARIAEQKTLTESVHKLAITLERLTLAQKSTAEKVDDLTCDVEEIKNKPAKKWDNAVSLIMTIVITAVVTYALTRIGLK